MIISASFRTDIPAFYAHWFLQRLNAGFADVRNPYGGQVYRVDLSPGAATGVVFWTRNLQPLFTLGGFEALRAQGWPVVVQATVVNYPRMLDRSVIAWDTAVEQLRRVAAQYGPRAVVWRYDPIVLTSLTPIDWHRDNFAHLCRALCGVTDEVATSFVEPYRKTSRNMAAAARAGGFTWHLPENEEKRSVLAALAMVAADHGLRLTVCTQPALEGVAGTRPARCVDAGRLSDVAGRPIAARRKGNRPGCYCDESRDIGAYDTCPHGCAYCYAVSVRAVARRRHDGHGRSAPML